ncbi:MULTISPECIES: ABC transporter substrate-binding protein [Arthrobacter]|uniref:ABC transporter substrate-binding protein n=1 Tax=Arthrobacter terricola TaxID=2547396 RepID=A0A4R5KD91_9MICC|nr:MULTISPECIES: ABC transporter substrate-binding protein [Arthrobacter]TDF92478.1 ABC transporter substrate-binding protein [Arthrobacter terricola]
MRKNKAVLLGAAGATLALTISACSFSGGNGNGAATGSANAIIDMQFTPRANFALETDDAFILSQIGCLETLVRYDEGTGKLQPSLATAWKQTTPTTWDFTIRDGVTFQNGTRLTAANVAGALSRALHVETPARSFKPSVVSDVKALDSSTVRVTSPAPNALIPFNLASVNTGILAPEAFKANSVDPIGACTGPFKPTAYTPGQSMKLVRNDQYWGTKPALGSVEAKFVPDGATRATQVRTGEADIALGIPASSLADLKGDKNVVVTQTGAPKTNGLYLNTSKAPFNNPDVRRAIQLAIDTSAISSQVYDDTAQPAIGPFAPNEPWSPKDPAAKQNLDQAKALLKSAGVDPGKLSLELLGYTEHPEFPDLATVIQSDLAKIGVTVKVRIANYAAIEPNLLSGQYDMALLSRNHLIDIPDPLGFLASDYTCKGSFNISHYCSPEMDKLIADAGSKPDVQDRDAIYARIARKLQDDAVTVFLVHEQSTAVVRANVKNFTIDPLARDAITPTLTVGG